MKQRRHRGGYDAPRASRWQGAAARPNSGRERKAVFVSYTGLLLIIASSIALLGLAWRIIEISAGRSLALAGQYDMALDWDASSAPALDGFAEAQIRAPGPSERARQAALDALTVSPLDDRPFAVLALQANRAGSHDLAEKLMQVAGRRSWRYPLAQAWLFSDGVAKARYLPALQHLDALFRLNEDSSAPLFPLAASFTVKADSSKALGEYLGRSPPWRSGVLEGLAARLRNRDNLVRLFEQLQETAAPPNDAETASLLNRLVRDQQYALARQVATKLQGEAFGPKATLYNGDFSRPLNGSPFNWQIQTRPGVEVTLVNEAGQGHALRLDYAGRVTGTSVEQILTLNPGWWTLTGEVRAAQLQSDMGVGWRLTCGQGTKPLAQTAMQSGDFGWKQLSVRFQVPEQGCPGQTLALVHPARVVSEETIQGRVWYRDLKIVPDSNGAGQ